MTLGCCCQPGRCPRVTTALPSPEAGCWSSAAGSPGPRPPGCLEQVQDGHTGSNSTEHIPNPTSSSFLHLLAKAFSVVNTTVSTRGEASAWSEDHPKPTRLRYSPLPSFPLANPKPATLQPKLPPSWGWCSYGDRGVLTLSLPLPNTSVSLALWEHCGVCSIGGTLG